MYERILVAVDGSKGSMRALDQGVKLQQLTGAEMFILTVYRHHSLLEASMSMVRPEKPENMDDLMREHAKDVAEEAKEHALKAGAAKVRAFVRNGPPSRTIVQFAKERDVGLILVGSRGMGGLGDIEDYLLGSVSHKVTGLADRPVMVV